jgi:hypothetical protein
MNRQTFSTLYSAAIARRTAALGNALLRPWHQDRSLPPVVGFGLPHDESVVVPLVTVGLNPSGEEYPNHIPGADDEAVQWEAQTGYFHATPYRRWFDRSDLIAREVTAQSRSHYATPSVPHLDLMPLGTVGPIDRVLKTANEAQQRAARALLRDGIAGTLLPLLSDLHLRHGLTHLVLYGFVPGGVPKGNDTTKPLFKEFSIFFASERATEERVTIARGSFNMRHEATRAHASLSGLTVLFMSQGPSSKATDGQLRAAARAMHARGWGPPG